MNITQHTQDGLHHLIHLVIEADEIEKKVAEKLIKLTGTVRMPGFRPGKVPVEVVEKHYKKSTYYEVLDQVVNQAVHEAVRHTKSSPALTPKVDFQPVEIGQNQPLVVEFDAYPEVEVGDLSAFSFEELVPLITDADVSKILETIASQQGKSHMEPVDRPAQLNDAVLIDFQGYLDGKPGKGMDGKEFQLFLGSGSFIPGFEDQLVGCVAGQEKRIQVTFPQDYDPALAGKEVPFDIKIHQVQASKKVEIGEEMAKAEGFESLADFKKSIEEHLKKNYEELAWERSKKPILDALSTTYQFPVPSSMIDLEFNHIWSQFQTQVQASREAQEEALSPEEEEKIRSKYREIADRRVRLGLLLSKVSELFKVQVTAEEINGALLTRARQIPGMTEKKFSDFIKYYKSNPQALESVKSQIFENKTLRKILEQGKVTQIKISLDDLNKEPEINPEEVFGA
jgi:trigger factor